MSGLRGSAAVTLGLLEDENRRLEEIKRTHKQENEIVCDTLEEKLTLDNMNVKHQC